MDSIQNKEVVAFGLKAFAIVITNFHISDWLERRDA